MAKTALIREDAIGIWVSAGGIVSRPRGETRFKAGDRVPTYHYGGSTNAGVGKDKTCKRGKYLEMWLTQGIVASEYSKTSPEKLQENWTLYRDHFVI